MKRLQAIFAAFLVSWLSVACPGSQSGDNGAILALLGLSSLSSSNGSVLVESLDVPLVSATPSDGKVTVSWASVSGADSYNLYWSNTLPVTSGTRVTNVISPYDHAGLTNGTTYYYAVAAVKNGEERSISDEASATPYLALPSEPSHPYVTVVSDTELTISWDTVSGADSYTIYWNNSGSVSNTDSPLNVASVAGATQQYSHTALSSASEYFYRIVAHNATGSSGLSLEVSGRPQIVAGAGEPQNPLATPDNGAVEVSWSAPSGGADSYNLYWSTSSPASAGTKVTGVTSPYVHTGLTNGTRYYYTLTAVSGGVESAASVEVSATPEYPLPTVPAGVSGTGQDRQNSLAWAPSENATSYKIYWNQTGGVTVSDPSLTVTDPGLSHTGLVNYLTYYYRIAAVGAGGESQLSPEVLVIPVYSRTEYTSPALCGTEGKTQQVNAPLAHSLTMNQNVLAMGEKSFLQNIYLGGCTPLSVSVGGSVVTSYSSYTSQNLLASYTDSGGGVGELLHNTSFFLVTQTGSCSASTDNTTRTIGYDTLLRPVSMESVIPASCYGSGSPPGAYDTLSLIGYDGAGITPSTMNLYISGVQVGSGTYTILYDGFGRIESQVTELINLSDSSLLQRMSEVHHYDTMGRIDTSTLTTTFPGPSGDVTNTTESVFSYDTQHRTSQVVETITSSDSTDITVVTWDYFYNGSVIESVDRSESLNGGAPSVTTYQFTN